MFIFTPVSVPEFLNKKFLDWQVQEGERKTISEYAGLFGARHNLMTMWMNGTRSPGPEYKQRIIGRYGAEAIEAFGEDPDLHYVQQLWDELTPETRRVIRDQVEELASQNGKRNKSKRRTRAT